MAALYDALAARLKDMDLDMVPAAVAAFKLEHLKTLSPSAKKEHDRLLTIFADEFDNWRVDQVESPDIKKACKDLFPDKRSAARAFKSRISTFYRWCIEDQGLLKVNPCREVWLPKPVRKKTPWTPALFWAVNGKLPPMQQCYHELSFLLYQRTTDVRLLERTQVRDGVIHFQPSKTKGATGAEVDVPITPAIQTVIDRAWSISKEWGVVCPYVVHTRQGTAFTRSGIYSAYRRADEALHGEDNLIGLNPKALLPFAVTTAKRQGATLEQLKVARAHASISTTEGYLQQHDTPVSQVVLRLPILDKPG